MDTSIKKMITLNNIFYSHCFECNCGREHMLPIKEIIVRENACESLGNLNSKMDLGRNGLVVLDKTVYKLIGPKILDVLEKGGHNCKLSLFTSDSIIANEVAIVKILNDIDENIDFLIAVGSGTINDLVRYVSFKTKIPYISIPTSPSMDGYTASVSLLVINNFKGTFNATHPLAIYADTEILNKAPKSHIASGFGDLLAKITACADWLTSNIINGEYYCEYTTKVLRQYVDKCIKNLSKIKNMELEGIKILTEGLMVSGITMHWVKSSNPVAGAEHHISHFWEMKALQRGGPVYLHGVRVGIGTLIMNKIYEKVLRMDLDERKVSKLKPKPENYVRKEWESKIRQIYGPVAEEVIKENSEKIFSKEKWMRQRRNIIRKYNKWKNNVETLIPNSEAVKNWLAGVGILSSTLQELDLNKNELKESIIYCKEIRNKFTILEMADYLGCLEEIAEEISSELLD